MENGQAQFLLHSKYMQSQGLLFSGFHSLQFFLGLVHLILFYQYGIWEIQCQFPSALCSESVITK
jgi:hypothetical protein